MNDKSRSSGSSVNHESTSGHHATLWFIAITCNPPARARIIWSGEIPLSDGPDARIATRGVRSKTLDQATGEGSGAAPGSRRTGG